MNSIASRHVRAAAAVLAGLSAWGVPVASQAQDRLKELQTEYSTKAGEKVDRVYHFGSQGPGDVYSNHGSHSNRQIPVYTWGTKIDLGLIMGSNSSYRDPEKLKKIYGFLPENTVNPEAEYADQSDIRIVLEDAAKRGAKHIFIVWFDGMDWVATQAAAIAKSQKVYTQGKGSGLIFQDYAGKGSNPQYGWVVTSPTYDHTENDVDVQSVEIPKTSMKGGYDVTIAGPNPWTLGPNGPQAPGYFKGQSANDKDKAGVKSVGRIMHAYTDSSQSAAEIVSGVKSYNNSINVSDKGKPVPTLFHDLQAQGWKTGVVTSVPFPHASPAGMYAQNVYRDDYQDLARCMFGIPNIMQDALHAPLYPGLDVIIGTGYGIMMEKAHFKKQGKNAVDGHLFIAEPDRAAINVKNGGKYTVVETKLGTNGGEALQRAADEAAKNGTRLFGFFGDKGVDHLPFRTADGNYDPSPNPAKLGKEPVAEVYSKETLDSQPTLAQEADAALTVLTAKPDQKFILFTEAGDVDFGLHSNNLDNAIGAVHSGEDAIKRIIHWVETKSNWDESVLVVSSDHGHYLVIDKPEGLLNQAK
ncbi:alkaline phosphatase [Paludisphaera rhizosphaerae]|uniref:alkaline phosphatase n=1 Tax=Paludisphaera rhizosphaerae TaxID=2711216 RepID=UPI0013EE2C2F|nr:alkaline phosphatase [Paludisphaera rhizosphaerae]